MAFHFPTMKRPTWWIWGGAAALLVAAAVAIWGFDLFSGGTETAPAVAIEQAE